jgi:hypothetical protein
MKRSGPAHREKEICQRFDEDETCTLSAFGPVWAVGVKSVGLNENLEYLRAQELKSDSKTRMIS